MRRLPILIALATLAGCANTSEEPVSLDVPSQTNQDAEPGGLFHDFIADAKYDAAGHPQGAEVFEGESRCTPTTGRNTDRGTEAQRKRHDLGSLCQGETLRLGDGTFALNARVTLFDAATPAPEEMEPVVLEIDVLDGDEVIATRTVTPTDFGQFGVEQDIAVTFRHRGDSSVRFDVRWTGEGSVRLEYVEVFRSTPRLVVSPASGVRGEEVFSIELQDPPADFSFGVACDDLDLTARLDELLEGGTATWTDTDFRTLLEVPAEALLGECADTSRVRVDVMRNGWPTRTARVTYQRKPMECGFDPTASVKVLLTGFEPFPANSDKDNSSKEAVEAYASGPLPNGVSVMHTILPVEYDAAPAILGDLIERCQPDVVVGFGQGRNVVDIEQIAYNRKDSAAIAGGVPDNRGVVYGGDPIDEAGQAERSTGLPVDSILAGLEGLGISARPSNDPGRYVCNNLFYSIMGSASGTGVVGGFVHLPRIPQVAETEREQLRLTVATVVDETVRARFAAATR